MGFEKGDELVVYVNNLGGLTYMEMGIFYRDLHEYLTEEKGFRIFEGRFGPGVTTQELAGMILSLGKVDDDIRKYWTPSK
jgi:dihydroxyacetone kinase-like protein